MAEFCYECYKDKIDNTHTEDELIISEDEDFCEGCGEYKPVVISVKQNDSL